MDMVAQESKRKGDKKGFENPAQEKCDGAELDICPDLLLGLLGAAAAAAFAVLFTQITMAGRKKKRSTDTFEPVDLGTQLQDVYWHLGILKLPHPFLPYAR